MTKEEAREIEKLLNEKIEYFEENEKKSRNLNDEYWIMIVDGVNSGFPSLKDAAMTLGIMGIERYAILVLQSMGIKANNEDFMQSVKLAVIEHLPQFDPTRGKATTYFKPHIHSAIMDEYKMLSSGPSESRYQQVNKSKVNAAIAELQKMGISDPSAEDVHAYLLKEADDPQKARSLATIKRTMEALRPTASLDELLGVSDDRKTLDPERAAVSEALKRDIEKAKQKLDKRSQFIIDAMIWWEENESDGKKKMPFKTLYELYVKYCDPEASQEMVRRRQRVALQNMRIALSRKGYKNDEKMSNGLIRDEKVVQQVNMDLIHMLDAGDDQKEEVKEISF